MEDEQSFDNQPREHQARLEKITSKMNNELLEEISALKRRIEETKNNETATVFELQKMTQLVTDTMDSEFQCSICNELFIKAVALKCSHTFCEHCVTEWEKTNNICPICRQQITTKTNVLVLDSYIEKMCENIAEELKEKRKVLVRERAAEIEAAKKRICEPPQTTHLLDSPSPAGISTRSLAASTTFASQIGTYIPVRYPTIPSAPNMPSAPYMQSVAYMPSAPYMQSVPYNMQSVPYTMQSSYMQSAPYMPSVPYMQSAPYMLPAPTTRPPNLSNFPQTTTTAPQAPCWP